MLVKNEQMSKQGSISMNQSTTTTTTTIAQASYRALRAANQHARYHNRTLDPRRVLRAWGLIRTGGLNERIMLYHTSLTNCDCSDYRNGNLCKHVTALMILRRVGK